MISYRNSIYLYQRKHKVSGKVSAGRTQTIRYSPLRFLNNAGYF